jgi:hypothetical protein
MINLLEADFGPSMTSVHLQSGTSRLPGKHSTTFGG